MNNFLLFSTLLTKPWAIHSRDAFNNFQLLHMVLENHSLAEAFFSQAMEPYAQRLPEILSSKKAQHLVTPASLMNPEASFSEATAFIPITGPLMKEDGLCSYGMQSMEAWIKQADNNPDIKNILLYIDSPGGTVDGMQALGDAVKNTKKETIAFVDGLAASAALWIASSADLIIAQNTTTEIGSVGAIISFADMRGYYEKEGVKFHDIVASQSTDKNKKFFDALQGNYETLRSETLDPLADMFIDKIFMDRPGSKPYKAQWAAGKVFFAQKALAIGLIDGIASLEQTMEMFSNPQTPNLNKTTMTKERPNLLKALEVEALESTDEGVFLSEEMLDNIEASLMPDPSGEQALQAAVAQLMAAVDDLTKDITSLQQSNAALTTVNESLKKDLNASKAQIAELTAQDEVPPAGGDSESDFSDQTPNPDTEAQRIYAASKNLKK